MELISRSTEIFSSSAERKEVTNGPDIGTLHAKIGQQVMEIDFLAVALECLLPAQSRDAGRSGADAAHE